MNEVITQKISLDFSRRFKLSGLILLLVLSLACQGSQTGKAIAKQNQVAPSPTPTKEKKQMNQDYIAALKKHDRGILDKIGQAPKELPREIDSAISTFDDEARELAVEFVMKQDSKYAGTFLLRRMNDSSPDVAMLAVESMKSISNKPSTEEIIAEIPSVKDSFIRGKLFMDVGSKKEEGLLNKLRPVVDKEEDEEAALQGLAALVKLGGESEAGKFIDAVRSTEPDDVLEMQGLMLYIGKSDIAVGLIPWLSNSEDIMRIGSDRQDEMARMSDVGVWTAHLLKIDLPFETTHLRNFTDDEIKTTEKKLRVSGNIK